MIGSYETYKYKICKTRNEKTIDAWVDHNRTDAALYETHVRYCACCEPQV